MLIYVTIRWWYFCCICLDGDGGVVDCWSFGVVSGLEIASTVTSLALALWWLVVRNTASYAWLLQVSRATDCMIGRSFVLSRKKCCGGNAYVNDLL